MTITLNTIYRKAAAVITLLSLAAAIAGAGYNYRTAVHAQEDVAALSKRVNELEVSQLTKDDLKFWFDQLDARLARIEALLMLQGVTARGKP